MFLLLLLSVFILYAVYTSICFILDIKKTKLPGPIPLPIVGNGHLFLVDSAKFLDVLSSLATKYQDALYVYIMSERYAMFSHPKYIEHIMSSSETITKGNSYYFLQPWLGQGLLTSTGQRWKTHRKFLTPAFHFNILQSFLPVFLRTEKVLAEQLQSLADGKPFDLFPIIALAALDNVTESIMGVSFNALKDRESKYVKSIETLSEIVSLRMRHIFLRYDMLFNWSSQKKAQDEALAVLHGHTKHVIETRRRELEETNIHINNTNSDTGIKNKHAFLDLLLLAEVEGKRIADESIREEVDTFMFEGHDTTASGLVYALYSIAQYEEVQRKVLEEQRAILGDDLERDPTYNELQQMKYLECVIKETLRLYPSVPLIQRLLTNDIDIMGMHLLKNTSVIINILHMQRNPAVFEDPLVFRPERYLTAVQQSQAYNWIPFSAGPRNCIGQKFAMMEMKVTLGGIVRRFCLRSANESPVLAGALILKAKNGVKICMEPRK